MNTSLFQRAYGIRGAVGIVTRAVHSRLGRRPRRPEARGEGTGEGMARKPTQKQKWDQDVTTVSTYPSRGLFTKDAQTIAKAMASKNVSPKGIRSGIRMIQFFINRAGKGLPAKSRRELEKAKRILQEKIRRKG
jgi:hypothetical protein